MSKPKKSRISIGMWMDSASFSFLHEASPASHCFLITEGTSKSFAFYFWNHLWLPTFRGLDDPAINDSIQRVWASEIYAHLPQIIIQMSYSLRSVGLDSDYTIISLLLTEEIRLTK